MIDYAYIIMKEYPGAEVYKNFNLVDRGNGTEILTWDLRDPQPTIAELEAKWPLYETEHDNFLIRKQRRAAYPAIGDQLDALLKQLSGMGMQIDADLQKVIDDWNQVKLDYPLR